ncbi:hypothetical protein CYMTET_21950 [Cymbomonas tetramitiformis]|uniref:Uncharacterized protein n=1 Tax=Cymbomonas tetramitiformis TaxID=36881 RepID=A0AAE0G0V2_9CHLO|nr:hypothetical protein CYMTET_21950 [Cymbomonas tetramitiformis]
MEWGGVQEVQGMGAGCEWVERGADGRWMCRRWSEWDGVRQGSHVATKVGSAGGRGRDAAGGAPCGRGRALCRARGARCAHGVERGADKGWSVRAGVRRCGEVVDAGACGGGELCEAGVERCAGPGVECCAGRVEQRADGGKAREARGWSAVQAGGGALCRPGGGALCKQGVGVHDVGSG